MQCMLQRVNIVNWQESYAGYGEGVKKAIL